MSEQPSNEPEVKVEGEVPTPSQQLEQIVEGAAEGAEGGETAEAKAAREAEEAAAAEAKKAKPAQPTDWRDARMAKQSQKIRDMTAELAKFQKQAPQGSQESPEAFEARVNAEADRRAQQIAKSSQFNKESLEAQAAGEATYGKEEFQRSVQALRSLRDDNDQDSVQAHTGLIVAALATGEAPKIVHMLGQDPNEAARIMGLEPVQMGIALARLAAKDAPQVSKAPPPIEPLGAKGKSRLEIPADDKEKSDDLSTKTWMERRQADIKAGRARARA